MFKKLLFSVAISFLLSACAATTTPHHSAQTTPSCCATCEKCTDAVCGQTENCPMASGKKADSAKGCCCTCCATK